VEEETLLIFFQLLAIKTIKIKIILEIIYGDTEKDSEADNFPFLS